MSLQQWGLALEGWVVVIPARISGRSSMGSAGFHNLLVCGWARGEVAFGLSGLHVFHEAGNSLQ